MVDQAGRQEQIEMHESSSALKQFELELINPEVLLQTLDLNTNIIPDQLKDSVKKSNWFSTDNGRILIEVRNQTKLDHPPHGLLYISDLDDTLFAATQWHEEEFRRLSTDPNLLNRGIRISKEKAKDLYDHSKMTLPGINEPRYTPKVNLILASIYASSLERGEPPEQAWETTLAAFNEVKDNLASGGEKTLDKYELDEDVVRCLLGNHTAEFIYEYFSKYFLEGTEERGTRAIVTRGTVEGPFGQVYKIHTAGVLDRGLGADIVLYTNDLKADALPVLYQLIPDAIENGTRVFDDNPLEIDNYLSWAKEIGIRNWEIIGVRHPTAKRKDYITSNKSNITWGKEDVRFDLYFASDDSPKNPLA